MYKCLSTKLFYKHNVLVWFIRNAENFTGGDIWWMYKVWHVFNSHANICSECVN